MKSMIRLHIKIEDWYEKKVFNINYFNTCNFWMFF
jgi:hypothetical protein